MKPIDVTSDSYAEYNEDSNVTKPKFEVVIMLGFQNTKTFYTQYWSEEFRC